MSRSQRETILVTASADGPPFRRSPNPKNLPEPTGVLSAMATTVQNGYRGSCGALQRPAEAARIARRHAVFEVRCIPVAACRGDTMSDDVKFIRGFGWACAQPSCTQTSASASATIPAESARSAASGARVRASASTTSSCPSR